MGLGATSSDFDRVRWVIRFHSVRCNLIQTSIGLDVTSSDFISFGATSSDSGRVRCNLIKLRRVLVGHPTLVRLDIIHQTQSG